MSQNNCWGKPFTDFVGYKVIDYITAHGDNETSKTFPPFSTLKLVCSSLINSHLQPVVQHGDSSIAEPQRWVITAVCNTHENEHTGLLFEDTKFEMNSYILSVRLPEALSKHTNRVLPNFFKNDPKRNADIHSFDTRRRNAFTMFHSVIIESLDADFLTICFCVTTTIYMCVCMLFVMSFAKARIVASVSVVHWNLCGSH